MELKVIREQCRILTSDYGGIYNIPMYYYFYFLVPRQMVRRLSTPILKAVPVSDMFAINESSVNIIATNTVYFYSYLLTNMLPSF